MEYFFAFVLGAVVGSFVNVCIYRLPRDLSLFRPGSRCSFCGQPIAWYDNIPIFSFIRLGGMCRYCQSVIGTRYLALETLTGGLFVLCYWRVVGGNPDYPPPSLDPEPFMRFWVYHPQVMVAYFIGAAFLASLVVATFIDFDFQIIPDSLTLGGFWVALVLSSVFPYFHRLAWSDPFLDGYLLKDFNDMLVTLPWGLYHHARALAGALLGGAVGAASVWIVGFLGRLLFRKEAMGFGDVKFNAMIGALLGWQTAIATLLLGSVIGAVGGIITLLRTKQTRMPFGPYLSLAAALLFLFREPLFRLPGWWTRWLSEVLPL